MKKILEKLFDHNYLEYEESKKVLKEISSKKYNNSQVASFLTVFKMRNPSVQEIEGFRDALLDLCVKIDLSSDFETIDLCGTGGDGKNTFNISTISSFVAAGAGIKVAKHGNYGVSSSCGSSNVLEFLGIKFSNKVDFFRITLLSKFSHFKSITIESIECNWECILTRYNFTIRIGYIKKSRFHLGCSIRNW